MQTDPQLPYRADEAPRGEIYDRGYRHYEGERAGRSHAIRALLVYSAKRGLGIKRRWTSKIIPFLLIASAFFPVIVIIGVRSFVGDFAAGLSYPQLYDALAFILLVFAATVAPEMLCDDRRQRVLQLYFSRPISRGDYLTAKLGALALLMGTIAFLPALFLFAGTMFLADSPVTYLGDNPGELARIVVVGALLAIYYAAIGLAISSFTERKSIAGAIYIGTMLIMSAIANSLFHTIEAAWSRYLILLDPSIIPQGITDWVFTGEATGNFTLQQANLSGIWYLAVVVLISATSGLIMYWRYLRDE